MLIYEMFTAHTPFEDVPNRREDVVAKNIIRRNLVLPPSIPDDAADLVSLLLAFDPFSRIGCQRHGYLDVQVRVVSGGCGPRVLLFSDTSATHSLKEHNPNFGACQRPRSNRCPTPHPITQEHPWFEGAKVDFLGISGMKVKPPFAPVMMSKSDYTHFPHAEQTR